MRAVRGEGHGAMAPDPDFEALLLYLKETRGFDFTGYKRSSLMRRVNRRIDQVGVATYADYLDHLQVHPEELTALFDTVLINVTGFFRDPEAWDYLREKIIPVVLRNHGAGTPIRVWSAGCASGEEAYTLAIILAEALGPDEFGRRAKIYATDLDDEGLSQARQATYTERDVRTVPPELLKRYFDAVGSWYVFHKDLRRSVIFGRNDLVQDAPISRIDLLVCRNTLMYFNAETQARILSRFHFALNDGGVLFLGKAEMLLSHKNLFQPIDLKRRVFRRVPLLNPGNGLFFTDPGPPHRDELVGLDRLRDEAFAASPVAQIVVTPEGLVALTNRQADALLGVSSKDVGRPFRDLEVSYRPVELRGFIEQAQVERRTVGVNSVELTRGPGETTNLEIAVNPLPDSDASLLGVTLVFHDVTEAHRLQTELTHAHRQLENADEELQSANEELETTNEELHSTVEELETTNEELQSTNEELETMNEELQSTNDELQSINDELRDRTAELDDANSFLEAILAGLRAAVMVVNPDMKILVWNARAEDLWGLRRDEAVGQHLPNLDIGLPMDRLGPLIQQALAENAQPEETVLPAVNRRGREILVRVSGTPLNRMDAEASGVILVMEVDTPRPRRRRTSPPAD